MDATRSRRTRDLARRLWYASHRQRRFARHMGFDRLPSVPLSLPAEPPQMFVGADEDCLANSGNPGGYVSKHLFSEIACNRT